MRGSGIGIIKASKSPSFPVGTYVSAMTGWAEFAILKAKHLEKIEVPPNGKLTDTLGVLGTSCVTSQGFY